MLITQSFYDQLKRMPPFIKELRDANRNGLKSQTRRVINPQPHNCPSDYMRFYPDVIAKRRKHYGTEAHMRHGLPIDFPHYGKAGDLCYMREPLVRGSGDYAFYKDDGAPVLHAYTGFHVQWEWKVGSLSQLYMPKFAARSFFQYEFIRVERVQDIRLQDIEAEGVIQENIEATKALELWINLWNSINAKRGYSWDVNPWVWVLGYKPFVLPLPLGRSPQLNNIIWKGE